jgi:hypothetical protein
MRAERVALVAPGKVMEQNGHRIAFVISVDRLARQDDKIDEAALHDVADHNQWTQAKVARENAELREKIGTRQSAENFRRRTRWKRPKIHDGFLQRAT